MQMQDAGGFTVAPLLALLEAVKVAKRGVLFGCCLRLRCGGSHARHRHARAAHVALAALVPLHHCPAVLLLRCQCSSTPTLLLLLKSHYPLIESLLQPVVTRLLGLVRLHPRLETIGLARLHCRHLKQPALAGGTQQCVPASCLCIQHRC